MAKPRISARTSTNRSQSSVEELLRSRLSRFLKMRASWKKPLYEILDTLQENGWEAVIFGGVLRDLVLYGPATRPRDVDIVVNCSTEELGRWLQPFERQRTRFGGFKIRFHKWNFDIWSLYDTWAFAAGHIKPSLQNLPRTTFFNIEGIAAQLNAIPRQKRELYSFGFAEAISSRVLDINFEPNPFPQLCIIRGLLIAARHEMLISSRLARYMVNRANCSEIAEIIDAQARHYGVVRLRPHDVTNWLDHIEASLRSNEGEAVRLPTVAIEQLELSGLGTG